MTDDYPSNSRMQPRTERPQRQEKPTTNKQINKVVQGGVKERKTPLGRRVTRNLFGGDPRSVMTYVFSDVLAPAARDMVADAVSGGVERMIFGEASSTQRRRGNRGGTFARTAYNQYAMSSTRGAQQVEPRRDMSRRARATHNFSEIVLDKRVEAELVIDELRRLIDEYGAVCVGELYEIVGISSDYTDNKWGWDDLRDARIQRVSDGYLLDVPRPGPID